ncbi:GNAT family N-acetyltransferase [Streptococcus himalayensis]|uniref:N-acetyltransferase n=1 Tax=Streptococcus himalayensis TaxID=1888195 RepID=A0A917A6S6_9STRE|nr:GNAT family N-acetyltransferase [Streptococcus himalayensis]GGE31756.1 N-acetyltransferase [Streptococcus himalayensis]
MIREAKVTDIPIMLNLLEQILQVHHAVRPDLFQKTGRKFQEQDLLEMLENPNHLIFVYEDEQGEVLGHLFCQLKKADSKVLVPVQTLFIEDLCVAEHARGQKIGQKLYQFAEELARENGCYNLTLSVWNDNGGALRFYEQLGLTSQSTIMEKIL